MCDTIDRCYCWKTRCCLRVPMKTQLRERDFVSSALVADSVGEFLAGDDIATTRVSSGAPSSSGRVGEITRARDLAHWVIYPLCPCHWLKNEAVKISVPVVSPLVFFIPLPSESERYREAVPSRSDFCRPSKINTDPDRRPSAPPPPVRREERLADPHECDTEAEEGVLRAWRRRQCTLCFPSSREHLAEHLSAQKRESQKDRTEGSRNSRRRQRECDDDVRKFVIAILVLSLFIEQLVLIYCAMEFSCLFLWKKKTLTISGI